MSVKPTATEAEPGAGQSQPGRRHAWPQIGAPGRGGGAMLDTSMARRLAAELIGTGLLVFFGAGMATVTLGFRAFGSSVAAGILLIGLTFGLVLLALFALIGPISGCHVNPAVSFGFWLARRMTLIEMVGYWIAQMIGGLLGALLLWGVMVNSPFYSRSRIGLGAQGYDGLSLLHASAGGAFLIEVIATAALVLVVLGATRTDVTARVAGLAAGFALAVTNFLAIPIDGASINPARSFGPAIVVGGLALSQLWLFLVAPLVGAILAAGAFVLFGRAYETGAARAAEPATTMAGAEEGVPAAAAGRVTTTPEMPPGSQRVVSGGTTTEGAAGQAGQGPASGQPPPTAPGRSASATPPEGNRLKQPAVTGGGGETIV